jgi:hypothetical protein
LIGAQPEEANVRRSPDQTTPEFRQLRIYAIDPMVSRAGEHQATVQIRFEDLTLRNDPKPAPPVTKTAPSAPISFFGRRIEVVDVDASGSTPVWLKPVNLSQANIAMQHGLDPSESDPQFHQQMVYAVAMRTIEQFDRALGRIVLFSKRRRLRLVPHAFRGGNAFYHPDLRAVLFGYFRASQDAPGENLPGQLIFTCLSHDIIAHEVTHALVDRLRPYFNVATNPHVRAFHEGFADIVAIFQRLSFRDLVQRALQEVRDLRKSKLLSDIAAQFGQGLGSGKALRTAIDDKTKIQDVHEEHALGAVLVAAIFDGFYTTFQSRTADLIRIATGGTGLLPPGARHPDLVARLTTECVRTAQAVLTMCIRAFDYLPPADVTFGAFLRALVTADWELNPLDEIGLRASIIEACRRRGIFAIEAGSLAVSALLLDSAPEEEWGKHVDTFRKWVDLAIQMSVAEQRAGAPDDGDGAQVAKALVSMATQAPPVQSTNEDTDDEFEPAKQLAQAIRSWFEGLTEDERDGLGMRKSKLKRPHFHSSLRLSSDGTQRFGLVVQLVEIQTLDIAGKTRKFPSGATLVIDVTGKLRFLIAATSADSRRQTMEQMAQNAMAGPMGWPDTDDPSADPFAVDYRGMHEVRT